ncbi:MAG: glycosyltransferase family 4 protein [Bacteroidota bacterium]|nr:glycosyltransferase family 4 protein [Bacteroidota bacterium]
MNNKPKILITGLFLSPANQHKIYRTAADQLAEVLLLQGYSVIKTSTIVTPFLRLLDTVSTILIKAARYNIAIVPMYGSMRGKILEGAALFFLKLLRKKIILVLHGGSIPDKLKVNPAPFLKLMQRADIVVSPSTFIAQAVQPYGIDCRIIENVVKLDDYIFHKKELFRPKLFWMRTFEDVYNPLMAVHVFNLLYKKYPEASMVMAGRDVGMLEQTKLLAKELGVLDQIDFPGYISLEQKNDYANDYDIYICTNTIDNAPVTIVEMMALGLPIVSTNAGGIPHLVKDGVDALLVDINNHEQMMNAINAIIQSNVFGKRLVQNARATAYKFGAYKVTEKWEQAFNELLSS